METTATSLVVQSGKWALLIYLLLDSGLVCTENMLFYGDFEHCKDIQKQMSATPTWWNQLISKKGFNFDLFKFKWINFTFEVDP